MSLDEALLVCALYESKERAERALSVLAESGIEGGELHPPGSRLHGVSKESWEVHVPQGQASRARVLLTEAAGEGRV